MKEVNKKKERSVNWFSLDNVNSKPLTCKLQNYYIFFEKRRFSTNLENKIDRFFVPFLWIVFYKREGIRTSNDSLPKIPKLTWSK